jgi:hypothetical protein
LQKPQTGFYPVLLIGNCGSQFAIVNNRYAISLHIVFESGYYYGNSCFGVLLADFDFQSVFVPKIGELNHHLAGITKPRGDGKFFLFLLPSREKVRGQALCQGERQEKRTRQERECKT